MFTPAVAVLLVYIAHDFGMFWKQRGFEPLLDNRLKIFDMSQMTDQSSLIMSRNKFLIIFMNLPSGMLTRWSCRENNTFGNHLQKYPLKFMKNVRFALNITLENPFIVQKKNFPSGPFEVMAAGFYPAATISTHKPLLKHYFSPELWP